MDELREGVEWLAELPTQLEIEKQLNAASLAFEDFSGGVAYAPVLSDDGREVLFPVLRGRP